MNIVNPSLPTGTKIYKLSEHVKDFGFLLNRHAVEGLRASYDLILSSDKTIQVKHELRLSHEQRCLVSSLALADTDTTDDYPFYRVVNSSFAETSNSFNINIEKRSEQGYSCPQVIKLNHSSDIIPFHSGLIMKYDPDSHSLVCPNQIYTGKLVKTDKFTEVNRAITSALKQLKSKLLVTSTILPDLLDKLRYKVKDTQQVYYDLLSLFPKLLDGTATLGEQVTIAFYLKQTKDEWDKVELKWTPVFHDRNYSWDPGIKRRIYYMYGAYDLPENYQEWFD